MKNIRPQLVVATLIIWAIVSLIIGVPNGAFDSSNPQAAWSNK